MGGRICIGRAKRCCREKCRVPSAKCRVEEGRLRVKVEKFEDLVAWQKARVLRKAVADATRLKTFRSDPSLVNQMRRSARSVMANVAEGFDKFSRPEFHRFLGIAKGSCAEIRSDLYAALDDELIDKTTFDSLAEMCDEVSRILAALRTSLREKAPI